MVTTFLIISFLLVLISFATYRWLLPKSNNQNERVLPPQPDFKSLFASDEKALAEMEKAETVARKEKEKQEILVRAGNGEIKSLIEAKALNDRDFYNRVLDILVENAKTSAEILSLASFIEDEKTLRSNSNLARKCLEEFRENSSKVSFVATLHTAALSDDASIFQETIETAIKLWQEEKLKNVNAKEIREIAESEFWILSQEARNSGAGFLLKQTLEDMRHKLIKN